MRVILLFLFWLQCVAMVFPADKIRIACIGNSITYGAGIQQRENNSYPVQLQAYLGDHYEVANFGVNGSTMLCNGDYPYIKTGAYNEFLSFRPDIILIKLGTNDSKPQNWKYKEKFLPDYRRFIERCKAMDSNPRIILMTPVRTFLPEGSDINAAIIEHEIAPAVRALAYENKLELIDLFHLFDTSWQSHLFPDQLHPSAIGAGQMARKIHQYLNVSTQHTAHFESEPERNAIRTFNFHGYEGCEFLNGDVSCLLVKPKRAPADKPWVIRARFWGHEPQTDIALLEQGFHIAYCDVADLYGSDKAVARWDRFYKRMRKAGFHKRVVLEGMSRGGLIVYNWVARNPEKVACIYADAPVMDFKSWPLGSGTSDGSAEDTERLLKAYGFKNISQAMEWRKNPVDHAAVFARHRTPLLHVVGDVDKVVPLAENTSLFEESMQKAGASLRVIHKPTVGHHPHSLSDPRPIVDFILRATGRNLNYCVIPVPGNEYRSAAGWKEGAEWHQVAQDITASLQGRKLRLLLIGNSITQGWGGNRQLVTHKPGKEILDEKIGAGRWESAGISGDRVQNVLWRVQNGNYEQADPENVIIGIGINNLIGDQDMPEEVAAGIIELARTSVKQYPNSRIILLGLLPSGNTAHDPVRLRCDRIHEILADTPVPGVEYINPTSWFTDSDGTLSEGVYSGDAIHLTGAGYRVWAERIAELIR